MKVIVLGAAAGGGFPQWNANSTMNRRAFAGDTALPRQTQCSLALSPGDDDDWLLLNCSPDIRQQIIDTKELQPYEELRSSPIKSVVLTNADVDAVAGLLSLRERQHLSIWSSDYILGAIEANPIFGVLDRSIVRLERIGTHGKFNPVPGLEVETFAAPGKPPLYLEHVHGIGAVVGATLGVRVTDARGKSIAFVPSCAEITPEVKRAIDGVDLLFFDGTMFTDDEMVASGEGSKTARRMGHMPMSGRGGSIETLREIKAGARYFIHINNSNLVLDRTSAQRRAVEAAGWKIAQDGMRIEL
ncbi:MAG: pyrroloquinoline quinone biosynthesis protein PqqB [Alphaproteobacteria bacterium]|nr:pyrroloquinoline quinone biosynthesis protein PqqB [Alphaproteobacteria bacterium]